MKCLVFRYPKNTVTDILISLLCIFIIVLILQKGDTVMTSALSGIAQSDRIEFFSSNGWSIDPESEQSENLVVPEKFDNTWIDFNELQKEQGFDFLPYCGKEIIRYTYSFLEFPGKDAENIYGSVFVYNGKIIGADIYSTEIDGFIRGVV